MQDSTKIRIKAIGVLTFMVVASPLLFIAAGVHRKWITDDTFAYGLKIMAATYVDIAPELWNEIKFGVEILER